MSALSDYLNGHIPADWAKRDVVQALEDTLDRTTVYRYLAGTHSRTPPEYVLKAFAEALGCSIKELREAAGAALGEDDPWVPPLEANRLTYPQRGALENLIRTMVTVDPPASARTREPQLTPERALVQVRDHIAQLRLNGHPELADRLEASVDSTNSASHTASRSSTV